MSFLIVESNLIYSINKQKINIPALINIILINMSDIIHKGIYIVSFDSFLIIKISTPINKPIIIQFNIIPT